MTDSAVNKVNDLINYISTDIKDGNEPKNVKSNGNDIINGSNSSNDDTKDNITPQV